MVRCLNILSHFFRPNDEKGWCALDNHHYLGIDDNGKWLTGGSYHKRVLFSKEYGTKDELLKKGYVENETMFYYPSNGEKDWRVGEWSWFGWCGEWNVNFVTECNFEGMKEIKDDHLYVLETKKSYVIRYNAGVDKYINENIKSIPKKDYLIIDLLDGRGGLPSEALKFAETIKASKVKKIIVLIDNTSSSGEDIVYALKDDKRVIYIGENTNGMVRGAGPKIIIHKKSKITLKLSTIDFHSGISEGIGFLPDIWIANDSEIDIMKNIWNITKDYELKIKYGTKIIDHDNYQKYKNGL